MAITAMGIRNKKLLPYAISIALAFPAYSGEWQFTPTANIKESYTDNVTLAPSDEEDSFVTQTFIDLAAEYEAQHAQFSLESTSTYAWFSHDSERNNDFYTFDANGRVFLWPNGIAFTAAASQTNQSRNSRDNALADIISSDTVRIERYQTGLEYQFSNSDYQVSSSWNLFMTESEDNIGEQEGNTFLLNSANGIGARNVFWNFTGIYSDIDNNNNTSRRHQAEIKLGLITDYKINPFIRYFDEGNTGTLSNNQSLESNSYGIGVRWLIKPRMVLDISYNEPVGDSLDNDGNEQDAYANVSLDWQLSSRTQVQMSHSQRFYGDSYGLTIEHANRRLTNRLSYLEEVQSFTRDRFEETLEGFFWCPSDIELSDFSQCLVQSGDNVDLDNYTLVPITSFELVEDQDYTLSKMWLWDSTLTLPRTTFTLTLSDNERENLTTRVIDEISTASIRAERKVSGFSTMALSASYRDNHYDLEQLTEQRDRYRRYGIEYKRQLNNSFNATFSIEHTNRSSTRILSNYEESRVNLQLSKDF